MKWSVLMVIFMIFVVTPLQAQKVALVLSGGGSKGVAHIGVIKALEDHGIPIDYVAGTSMGAIIGGLYAAGYSPEQMTQMVNSDEFTDWVESDISKKYRYYYKKHSPDASRFSIQYDLKSKDPGGGLSIPVNIITPFQMDFAMLETYTLANAVAQENFDSLFVPFRCVAADIANNEAVVLRDGDLGAAIRASMTFPFYFKPIEVDGKVLFDGGMYNNFPKDVVEKDFQPDVIIGSKVASNYGPPKTNDIISQLQTMLMENTDYSIDSSKGVLIAPNIPPTNITDFSNTNIFIDSGYLATDRMIDSIRMKINRFVDKEKVQEKRRVFQSKQKPLKVGNVIPVGVDEYEKKYIINSFRQKLIKGASLETFKKEYFKIVADQRINYAYPTAHYNPETKLFDIHLDIEKNESLEVGVGGNISSEAINEAFVKINYNKLGQPSFSSYAQTYIGRFYSAVHAGTRLDNSKRFPFYVQGDISYNQWDYFETSTYFFEDKQPSYLIQDDSFLSLEVGIPAGQSGVLSVGAAKGDLRNEYYQENSFTRSDTADITRFAYLTQYAKFEFNSLNRKLFASQGRLLIAKIQLVSGDEHYTSGSTAPSEFEKYQKHRWLSFKFKMRHYFPDIYYSIWGVHLEAVYSKQKDFTNYTSSALVASAFQPFTDAMARFKPTYRSYSYAAAGLLNITPLSSNIDLRVEGYLFLPYQELTREEFGTTGNVEYFKNKYYLATTALVYHSPLGPVSFSVNYYTVGTQRVSAAFNFGYLIFNKRPLKW